MATSPDYAILSAPRITAAGFAAVLQAAGSPATPEASACYQAFVGAGVDPAVGLAVFRKESTFGRFGRANANRSWGNIRGAGGYPTDSGGFRIYPSWTVGALDAARLLAIYGRNAIRPGTKTDTVQTFPYVWAPSSDGNAPDAYGDQLAAWIGDWQRKYPASGFAASISDLVISSSSPSILSEFLATIGRRESDPVREIDVMPFVQFLQSKQIVPGGSPNLNPLVNAVVIEVRATIGRPWSEVGPSFIAAARQPQDPFGLGAALGGFGKNLGEIAWRGGQAVSLAVIIILGLYLLTRG